MEPHDVPMTVLGAGLLWFGWFGFNAGSALAANGLAANAFMVTNTAAAAATITWVLASYLHKGKVSVIGAACGAVAGLVAITPASGFVTVGGALIIGLVAGGLCYSATLLRARLKVDDALDVFAVHGVGGMFGAVATGVFASAAIQSAYTGLLEGNSEQLVNQLIAVGATVGVRRRRHVRDRQGRRRRPRHPRVEPARGDRHSTWPSTARPPTRRDAGRRTVGPDRLLHGLDRPTPSTRRPPQPPYPDGGRFATSGDDQRRWTPPTTAIAEHPLYDARFEHDACGVGFVADAGGRSTRARSCRWRSPGWPRSATAGRSGPTASRATGPASRCRSIAIARSS